MTIPPKLCYTIDKKGRLPNLFQEVSITPYQNLIRTQQKSNLYNNLLNEHRHKNSQKNTLKPYPSTHWKDHTPLSSWFHSKNAKIVQCTTVSKCNVSHKKNQG
jgi:hypothetical protein